jgi:hypothetical protein
VVQLGPIGCSNPDFCAAKVILSVSICLGDDDDQKSEAESDLDETELDQQLGDLGEDEEIPQVFSCYQFHF